MHTQEAYTFKRYVRSGSRQRLVVQATAGDAARNGARGSRIGVGGKQKWSLGEPEVELS
jgi:hypothetical protein